MDLLGVDLTQRAAEDREVLREHKHLAPVDLAPPGDHTVGERPVRLDAEPVRAVAGEHVELDEGSGVEQQIDALAGGELASLVLAPHRRLRTGVERLFLQLGEMLEAIAHGMSRGWERRAARIVSHTSEASWRPRCGRCSGRRSRVRRRAVGVVVAARRARLSCALGVLEG